MQKKPYGSAVVIGCSRSALTIARQLTECFERVTLIEPTDADGADGLEAARDDELMADLRTHPQVRFVPASGYISILLNSAGTSAIGVAFASVHAGEPSAVIADLMIETRPASTRPVEHLLHLTASNAHAATAALRTCLAEQQRAHRHGSLVGLGARFERQLLSITC